MSAHRIRSHLSILQWVLGFVILAEAAIFAFSPAAAHSFARTGMPNAIRWILAWGEIAAVILFLIPQTVIAGGWFLVAVLGFAIIVHLLHGWWNVGSLVIYALVAWTVISVKSETN